MQKYRLTDETMERGVKVLHRIEAVRDFGNVKKGDKGGWVEGEDNLSHDGDAWVYDDAWVFGDARVFGDAEVYGDAEVFRDVILSTGYCFGYKGKNWDVTEVDCGDVVLLVKDYN